mgnify:CR=1 FL=1
MTDSNLTQLAVVRETTLGTTPNTPRMRLFEFTDESLKFVPNFVQSQGIRSDRMNSDPIKVGETNSGGISFELQYPDNDGPISDIIRLACMKAWTNTNERYNDGTADSVITGVATSGEVVTVTTGTAFIAKQLVKLSGFGVSGNNGVFKCTTGSATVPAFVGAGLTDEAAPAAQAKMKVVGVRAIANDLAFAATTITSAADISDFSAFLAVGQWVKISGCTDQTTNNVWARVQAIAGAVVTFDNIGTSSGSFTVESAEAGVVSIWFGDYIRNGTTLPKDGNMSLSIERGFLAQATPTYIVQTGMAIDELTFNITKKQVIKCTVSFMGMSGSQSTTALDASPDAISSNAIMSGSVNVARVSESGSRLTSPNWSDSVTISIKNNLRMIESVDSVSAVSIGVGENMNTGTVSTYFGSNTLLAKLLAGTVGNLNSRIEKNSQAVIITLPRLTFTDGSPNAGGKNQDVMLPLQFQASKDTTYTNAQIQFDRLPFYQ